MIFYPGRQTEFYDSGKEKVRLEELEGIRFIQNYQDEFFDLVSVQENAFQWRDLDISVLTNSDYIMEKMLKNSKVSNVSGSYLSENKKGTTPGIPLELGNNKVIFGYIFHKGEKNGRQCRRISDVPEGQASEELNKTYSKMRIKYSN